MRTWGEFGGPVTGEPRGRDVTEEPAAGGGTQGYEGGRRKPGKGGDPLTGQKNIVIRIGVEYGARQSTGPVTWTSPWRTRVKSPQLLKHKKRATSVVG